MKCNDLEHLYRKQPSKIDNLILNRYIDIIFDIFICYQLPVFNLKNKKKNIRIGKKSSET